MICHFGGWLVGSVGRSLGWSPWGSLKQLNGRWGWTHLKAGTWDGCLLFRAVLGLFLPMQSLQVASPAELLDFLHGGSGLPIANISRRKKQKLPDSLKAGPGINTAVLPLHECGWAQIQCGRDHTSVWETGGVVHWGHLRRIAATLVLLFFFLSTSTYWSHSWPQILHLVLTLLRPGIASSLAGLLSVLLCHLGFE